MTGDGNLNLIFILSYLSYLSPSITDTHLRLYIFTSILWLLVTIHLCVTIKLTN